MQCPGSSYFVLSGKKVLTEVLDFDSPLQLPLAFENLKDSVLFQKSKALMFLTEKTVLPFS